MTTKTPSRPRLPLKNKTRPAPTPSEQPALAEAIFELLTPNQPTPVNQARVEALKKQIADQELDLFGTEEQKHAASLRLAAKLMGE